MIVPKLEKDKTYLITAQRKGTFMMKVTSQSDTWTYGVVVGGETKAMLDYNKSFIGDDVTCRTSFIQSAVLQI
ncbi:MAG: hypothetical protein JKY22_12245 [Flavobacteriaceae bacterium]|nr:hypothetical protein [Flavobacteriaceae bacterium]